MPNIFDENYCQSCVGYYCTGKPGCVTISYTIPNDSKILDWLEQNPRIEICREDDDGEDIQVLYRVSGSRNDRTWTEVGRGPTLRTAVLVAMKNS